MAARKCGPWTRTNNSDFVMLASHPKGDDGAVEKQPHLSAPIEMFDKIAIHWPISGTVCGSKRGTRCAPIYSNPSHLGTFPGERVT
ncbi:hypothetical protein GCM10011499_33670 [Pelagibacterium lentulum]|uniref:Uncharacterized protein n=1 Tax=Pelagibacterium lentulum TaxID=2029865 RepID=A0A916RL18_9HYPH|nr:hypothetical protein GCM10011499_33670 [Pelagibacterium lentulum]